MRIRLSAFTMAMLFILCFYVPAFSTLSQTQDDQSSQATDDEEIPLPSASIDKPLQIQIDKDRPDFLIKVSSQPSPNSQPDNPLQSVTIKIGFNCISSTTEQIIRIKVRDDISPVVEVEDVNFDGYPDIKMVTDFGAKWEDYSYWLFDKSSAHFVSNSLTQQMQRKLSGYNDLTFDADNQTILAHLIGPCFATAKLFKIVNNRVLFVNSVTDIGCDHPELDAENDTYVLIKELIKGKIKSRKTHVKGDLDIIEIYYKIFPKA